MTEPTNDPAEQPTDDQQQATGAEPVEEPSPQQAEQSDPAEHLGDPGKKALDSMKRERNQARKDLADVQARLKEYEDKDKTETQRLQETAESNSARATKAEASLASMQVALDRAPAHATLEHVRAVAKRVRGDTDDDLAADADELFALVAPQPAGVPEPARPAGRPTERLRGAGAEPDEEPVETDPGKLAALIPRR